jgi:hypothetical protein
MRRKNKTKQRRNPISFTVLKEEGGGTDPPDHHKLLGNTIETTTTTTTTTAMHVYAGSDKRLPSSRHHAGVVQ